MTCCVLCLRWDTITWPRIALHFSHLLYWLFSHRRWCLLCQSACLHKYLLHPKHMSELVKTGMGAVGADMAEEFHWNIGAVSWSKCCFTDVSVKTKIIKWIVYFYSFRFRLFFLLSLWTGRKHRLWAASVTKKTGIRLSWILVLSGLALSQAGRSPGDGKQVWKWTCSPSVPPSSLSSCNEEQWLYFWREGTPSHPSSSSSCLHQSTATLLASQQMTGLGRIWPLCT